MRKIIALLFAMLMILTVSCAETDVGEISPDYDSSVDEKLDGFNCVIVQSTIVDKTELACTDEGNPFGYTGNTALADDVLKRISDIEDKLGCEITIKYDGTSASVLALQPIVGDYVGEAIYSASQEVTHTLMKNYSLYPLETLDEINITDVDKWGGANVLEVHALDGHAYAVCPMNWLYKQPRSISIFVVNGLLEKQFGITNPREYIENGSWTWSTFENTLREHTVVDGETTYYGLTCRFFDFVKLAVLGNGCQGVYRNSNGQVVSDFSSDKALEGMEWAKKIALEYGDCLEYGTKGNDWPETTDSFINNRSMMDLTSPSVLFTQLIYKCDDFTVMPFPTGDSGVYGEWPSVLESADSFSIFINAKEPEATAKILNMLCEPLDSYSSKDDMISYLASNVLYGEKDAEVIMNAHKNGKYSYWWGLDTDSFWRAFQDGKILNSSIVQIVESKSGMLDNIVEENMVPNYVLYDLFE